MGINKSYLKELAEKKKYQSGGFSTEDKQFSVKKSTIPGANKGLFSKTPIKQGKLIGLAHENNQPFGTLGNRHNHSETPNMQSVKIGNQRYVYATRDIQPGEELTTNYRLQPELEQPEDFMGNKRFGQKGLYKPDFRSKSQIANTQGRQREYSNVPVQRTPTEAKAIREKNLAELKRKTVGTIRETTDADREAQNRQDLTFAGNAEKRGASSPLNDILDVVNPFSYYYSAKDIGKGLGQAAKGVYNLDPNQIAGGLTQAGLNALNVLPAASELKPALKGAGKYLTTQTPLRNTYKINPFAFKPNPNSFYRQIGNTGLKDALESGVIRSADQTTFPRPHFVEGKDFKNLYSTGSGAHGKPSVIFETSGVNAEGMPIVFPTHVSSEYAPWISGTSEIPLSQGRLLQKDWLRGYKPVEVPKQSFKSEIDWAKWNPDTPKYPELINEYNAIEETTKKAGTWMKNPDGSAFQGTPEQFIQQQSSYFKKAFGDSKLVNPDGSPSILYHGSRKKFNTFDESKFGTKTDGGWYGKGIYTSPDKHVAKSYSLRNENLFDFINRGKVYELYVNSKNPGYVYKNNVRVIPREMARDFNKGINDDIDKFNYDLLDVKEPGFSHEVVIPFKNNPKSAVGNVGFFDMTNPNIYKGVLPYVLPIGAGLGTGYMMQNQKPKGTYQGGGTMGIPGVNGQVVSSGPTPLTSVKKTRGSMSMDNEGNIKTMPTKAVKKILKNIK